jgi:hypothetical protein
MSVMSALKELVDSAVAEVLWLKEAWGEMKRPKVDMDNLAKILPGLPKHPQALPQVGWRGRRSHHHDHGGGDCCHGRRHHR